MDESNQTIPEALQGYDWEQAFQYTRNARTAGVSWMGPYPQQPGFTVGDVAEVLASVNGENDGPNWVALVLLKDGRFATISAGCDYTGWDCQSGGAAYIASTREDAIRFGLDVEERARLGLSLPGESQP